MRWFAKPGSALLAATLLAALLALAATGFIARIDSARLAVADQQKLLKARLDAESLIQAAIVAIDKGEDLAFDGSGAHISLGEAAPLPAGQVRIQNATGLIDLNAADPSQIAALIVSLGAAPTYAATIADRIADWRDEDSLRRPRGAERSSYQARQRPDPRNGPFQLEDELLLVLGSSPDLVRCLEPYVTVFSGRREVSPAHAPHIVRDALKLTPPSASLSKDTAFGQVLIIRAEAPLSDSAALRVTQWVRLTGQALRPYLAHRARLDFAAADQDPRASCIRAFSEAL